MDSDKHIGVLRPAHIRTGVKRNICVIRACHNDCCTASFELRFYLLGEEQVYLLLVFFGAVGVICAYRSGIVAAVTRVYHNDTAAERRSGLRFNLECKAAVRSIADGIAVESAGSPESQAQGQRFRLAVRYPLGGGDYLAAGDIDFADNIAGMAEGDINIFSVERCHGIERTARSLRRRDI